MSPADSGSAGDGERGPGCWLWSVGLVASLYLLTSAGTWLVSDHAELLFMARQLITRGTLTLAPAGGTLPELHWIPLARDAPTRSRLFPGSAVAMAPLVAIDRWMGWDDPKGFGWMAHLGGHVFVLSALVLIGSAVRRGEGSSRGAAAAVILGGTSWPVWQISRHGGAEPVVGFLFALFLWAHQRRGHLPAQAVACGLLPWTHPTGFLLAPVLAASPVIEAAVASPSGIAAAWRRSKLLIGVALGSLASVILVWNWLYHGNLWGGGYANQGVHHALFSAPPQQAAAYYLREGLSLAPLPVALALIGAFGRGRDGWRVLVIPLLMFGAYLLLFSVFTMASGQEPARRLSVVWLAWAAAAGRSWNRLPFRGLAALGTLGMSVAIGYYWFLLRESHYYPRGDGLYDPLVLWLTLAREGRPAWYYLLPVAALSVLGLIATFKIAGLMRTDGR